MTYDDDTTTSEKAAAAGRGILWIIAVVLLVVAVLALFLLGPIGFVIVLAVGGLLGLVWMTGAFTGGGPA